MELKEWATRILSATTLEEKLYTPRELSDLEPGPAIFWDTPSRPQGMAFTRHDKEHKLPPLQEHYCQDKRAACLHRFAGHELLAVEIMAYALLAFPNSPKHFRKGLANTLKEEQEHVRLYMKRLLEMGIRFGDMPLYRHFWSYVPFLTTPEKYVSVMSLTFEMANLDFAPMYRNSFTKHGDLESALLMNRILEDEIAHVSFGFQWLKRLKPKHQTDWEAWRSNSPEPLSVKRAKGFVFQEEPRKAANIPPCWIEAIKQSK
ncbi:MAG: DUF455 family protein [Chlamydiae bacterium]|nr:DUF455 family protein [Chlamydiota bacterium]